MSKALGIVSLIFGSIGVTISIVDQILQPFIGITIFLRSIPILSTVIVAMICGGFGIQKDDSPRLAITGLVLGSIGLVIFMVLSILYYRFGFG